MNSRHTMLKPVSGSLSQIYVAETTSRLVRLGGRGVSRHGCGNFACGFNIRS